MNKIAVSAEDLQEVVAKLEDQIGTEVTSQALTALIDILPQHETEVLVELGREHYRKANSNWLILCLIANTIAKRWDGSLEWLAEQWGIAYKRLSEMSSIWENIISRMLAGQQIPPSVLEQEFYHTALRATDPVEAIVYAETQKGGNSGFSVADLRHAIQLKEKTGELPTEIETCFRCKHFTKKTGNVTVIITEEGKEVRKTFLGSILACAFDGVVAVSVKYDPRQRAAECSAHEDKQGG